MPLIKFIEADGQEHEIDAEPGISLMQVAVDNAVAGILGDCGGGCSCATCHCYIQDEFLDWLTPPDTLELEMLQCAVDPKANSRLSCQIDVSDELDGMVVHLPESQF